MAPSLDTKLNLSSRDLSVTNVLFLSVNWFENLNPDNNFISRKGLKAHDDYRCHQKQLHLAWYLKKFVISYCCQHSTALIWLKRRTRAVFLELFRRLVERSGVWLLCLSLAITHLECWSAVECVGFRHKTAGLCVRVCSWLSYLLLSFVRLFIS